MSLNRHFICSSYFYAKQNRLKCMGTYFLSLANLSEDREHQDHLQKCSLPFPINSCTHTQRKWMVLIFFPVQISIACFSLSLKPNYRYKFFGCMT